MADRKQSFCVDLPFLVSSDGHIFHSAGNLRTLKSTLFVWNSMVYSNQLDLVPSAIVHVGSTDDICEVWTVPTCIFIVLSTLSSWNCKWIAGLKQRYKPSLCSANIATKQTNSELESQTNTRGDWVRALPCKIKFVFYSKNQDKTCLWPNFCFGKRIRT